MQTFFLHNFQMYQCSTSFLCRSLARYHHKFITWMLDTISNFLWQFFAHLAAQLCQILAMLPCRYIKSWKLKMLSIIKSPQQQAALKSSWGWLFLVKESSGHVHNRSELILYNLHPLKLTLLRIGRVLSRERVRKVCSIRE